MNDKKLLWINEIERLSNLWEISVKLEHLKDYSFYNHNYYKIIDNNIWVFNVLYIEWQDDDFQPRYVILWNLKWIKKERIKRFWKEITRNIIDFDQLWYLFPEDYSDTCIINFQTLKETPYY